MLVRILPITGTHMHVWDRKKYYPGGVYTVSEELGETLIKQRIGEKIEAPKRGPGRPPSTKRRFSG